MATDAALQHLLQLAELDKKLKTVGEQRAQPSDPRFQLRQDRLQALTLQSHAQVADLRARVESQELRLSKLATFLQEQTKKLYAGAIKTTRELQSLELEIAAGDQEKGALEESLLAAMECLEAEEKKLPVLQADLQEAEADLQEFGQDEQKRQVLLTRRWEELTAARIGICAHLPKNTLDQYQRLLAAQGEALAKVKAGSCLGCRMAVPDSHWRGVKQGLLLTCPTCGRFLHE